MSEQTVAIAEVWLTYYEPSAWGYHKGVFASLDLAKRSCETNVEEWISSPPWDKEDEPHPVLHPVKWTLEPDPGLPDVFHRRVPEDKYVWVGRYCDEQPTWFFKIRREGVFGVVSSPGKS